MRRCGTRYSSRSSGYDKSPREQDYIAFLWDAFETNYTHGKYQFVFLAYHMLTMSCVYFNIMAELLTVEAGYAATFKDQVYSALLHHVRAKFLNGSSLGLAESAEVDFAWKMLRQVKAKVGAIPGLIAGIVEYGN